MAYIAAKCPACGAGIQVPDDMQKTFCSYCGSSIVSEEAIKLNKVQVIGTVEVSGIATLDRLIQNAEANMKINEIGRARKVYEQITEDYPDDYRGWWGLLRCCTSDFSDITFHADTALGKWYNNAYALISSQEKKEAAKQIYTNHKSRRLAVGEIKDLEKRISQGTSSSEFRGFLLGGAIVFTILDTLLIIARGYNSDNALLIAMTVIIMLACWGGFFHTNNLLKKEKIEIAKFQEALKKAKVNYSQLEDQFANIKHLIDLKE